MPNTFLGWSNLHYNVHSKQKCPTKVVQDKTPIEAWSERKPLAKNLQVFGCICYIHVHDQRRYKLEDKTIQGIFLGYNTQSKSDRVYNI